MKAFDLNQLEVQELNTQEMTNAQGGFLIFGSNNGSGSSSSSNSTKGFLGLSLDLGLGFESESSSQNSYSSWNQSH
jgi:hypothetical protein